MPVGTAEAQGRLCPAGLRREGVSVPWIRGPAVRARLAPSPPVVPGVTEGAQGALPAMEMGPQQVVGRWRVRRLLMAKGEATAEFGVDMEQNWVWSNIGWPNSPMTTFFNSSKWQWLSPRSCWADTAYWVSVFHRKLF